MQGVASADFPITLNPAPVNGALLGDFETDLQALGVAIPPPETGATSSLAGSTAASGDASERICEPTTSSLYCVYTVQPGDSLSAVAEEFGLRGTESLPAAEILAQSNKPAVVQSDSIVPGLKLRIPVANGIIHTVLTSETLPEVAERYGVSASAIQTLAINNITNPDLLLIGQEILVPDPIGVFSRQSEPPSGLPAAADDTTDDPPTPQPTPTAEPEQTLTPVPLDSTPTSEPTATPTPDSEPTPDARAAHRDGHGYTGTTHRDGHGYTGTTAETATATPRRPRLHRNNRPKQPRRPHRTINHLSAHAAST